MYQLLFRLIATVICIHSAASTRTTYNADHNWKFLLAIHPPGPAVACPLTNTWSINLNNQQTNGLHQVQALTEAHCADQCCAANSTYDYCETYQFCNTSDCGSGPPSQASCWIGNYQGATTKPAKGWHGKARVNPSPSPPPPPPSPSPSPSPTPTPCKETWCQPTTDDTKWRTLNVPHDFVVEGNFTSSADKSHGYLPYNIGFYRKQLSLPVHSPDIANVQEGTHVVYLVFDGVQAHAQVFLDGEMLGSHASGYTPFHFLLSDKQALKVCSQTHPPVLAVKADATKPDGWWYDGGGIYRHVKMVVLPRLHIDIEGGAYMPSKVEGVITNNGARAASSSVSPSITVQHVQQRQQHDAASTPTSFVLTCTIADRNGTHMGVSSMNVTAPPPPATNKTYALPKIIIPNVSLWSPAQPILYSTACTLVVHTLTATDTVTDYIGIRQPAWNAHTGFSLNGKHIQLSFLGVTNLFEFRLPGLLTCGVGVVLLLHIFVVA